jgi:DNA-binding MurR/RpiR family transcriptional regulator
LLQPELPTGQRTTGLHGEIAMSYEDRIRDARPAMSKSFAKLADFLLDAYIEAAFMTATELAHAVDVDATTVVRFSQTLGYPGYPGLLREIRAKVKHDLMIRPKESQEPDSFPGALRSAMEELSRALEQTRMLLDTDAVSELTQQITMARRIVVVPEGPAQPAAYNLVHFLEQGGFAVYVSRSGVADLSRTVFTATSQDLLLAIEVSGEAPYIARALNQARARGIPTAAILGAASLASARYADVVLVAQPHPAIEVGIVTVNAVVFALAQALRWRFSERFSGAQQSIQQLSAHILEEDS